MSKKKQNKITVTLTKNQWNLIEKMIFEYRCMVHRGRYDIPYGRAANELSTKIAIAETENNLESFNRLEKCLERSPKKLKALKKAIYETE
jgi:hypothetical protein